MIVFSILSIQVMAYFLTQWLMCHFSEVIFSTLGKFKNMSSQIIFNNFQDKKLDGNNYGNPYHTIRW